MRMIWLLMILFGTACQEAPVEPAVDAGVVTPADAGVVRCGTARAEFPEGLVELSWDDGEIGTSPYTAMASASIGSKVRSRKKKSGQLYHLSHFPHLGKTGHPATATYYRLSTPIAARLSWTQRAG